MHQMKGGWGGGMQGGMGHEMMGKEFAMKMMVFKMLTPEQKKAVILRSMDLKLHKKEFLIGCMQQKIQLMQEKMELYKMIRNMVAANQGMGMGGYGGQGFGGRQY